MFATFEWAILRFAQAFTHEIFILASHIILVPPDALNNDPNKICKIQILCANKEVFQIDPFLCDKEK